MFRYNPRQPKKRVNNELRTVEPYFKTYDNIVICH